MALRAGQIELALALLEDGAAGVDERLRLRIVLDGDRHAARLPRDIGGQRQQLLALERQRPGFLVGDATQVDLLLEIDGTAELRGEGRIARGDALHAFGCVAVTVGA